MNRTEFLDPVHLERNEKAKKYKPLVKKIVNQLKDYRLELSEKDLEGFGWVGFVNALNRYDPTRSNMSFTSFAAYEIRNAILSAINECGTTINISYYKKKQMINKQQDIPKIISLDEYFENQDYCRSMASIDYNKGGKHIYKDNFDFHGTISDEKLIDFGFADRIMFDSRWKIMIERLKERFDDRYLDVFFSTYGIDCHKIEKGKDIAKRLGISGALVTKRIKKVIDYIKSDKELCELLKDLL